jgi:hypothetical protein
MTSTQSNSVLARVVKAGAVQLLPDGMTMPNHFKSFNQSNPSSPRSTTPVSGISKPSLKKSVRFDVPVSVPKTLTSIESNTIELDSLEPFETATYQVDTNRVDVLRSVAFCVMVNDEFAQVVSTLKTIDVGSFCLLISNPTEHKRDIKLSFTVTFD